MSDATRRIVVATLQHPAPADASAARRRIEAGIAQAAARGVELLVLQELHEGPYFCLREDPAGFEHAQPVPGPTTQWLAAQAAGHRMVIVGSVFEARGAGVYHNTAVVLDADGSLAGRYRKMHIPEDPGYHEKFYFTPGEDGFRPIDTRIGRLGVLVCWDQWFPEAARAMALRGAELLIYPSAIGWGPDDDADEQARQREAWITVQRGHAIANALPLICCNRVGEEQDAAGGLTTRFWGSSFVCGPQGELLAVAGTDQQELTTASLDLARTEQLRRIWPFLRDRRTDAYQVLLRRLGDGDDG